MDRLASFLEYLSVKRFEEDFVDRLFFRHSPRIFILCALLVVAKEYVGEPIQCWAGPEWSKAWNQYANDYCFVEGTYYVNVHDRLERVPDRYKHYKNVDYYPWLAFVLAFQAIICYTPYFIWSSFNSKSGLALKTVNSIANTAAFTGLGFTPNERFRLSGYIYSSLRINRQPPKTGFIIFRMLKAFYRAYIGRNCLVIQYLFMKIMNIALTLLQIKFISSFIGKSNSIWDFADLLETFKGTQSWETTGTFPRSAFCDFEVRGLERNIEKHTIQCVLIANMINEKIFIMVWWWLWIMVAIGAVNLLCWIRFLTWSKLSSNYIFNAIVQGNASNDKHLTDHIQQTWNEHQKRVQTTSRIIDYLNQEFIAQKLPVKHFDCQKMNNDPEVEAEIQKCISKYWTFNCDPEVEKKFMKFLGPDGVLFFRLMELNSSTPVVNELLSQLFHDFVSANLKFQENDAKIQETKEKKLDGALPSHLNHFTPALISGA